MLKRDRKKGRGSKLVHGESGSMSRNNDRTGPSLGVILLGKERRKCLSDSRNSHKEKGLQAMRIRTFS